MKKFRWFLVGLLITGIVLGGIGIAYAGNGIRNGQGIFGKMFGKGFKDGAKIGVADEKIADFLGIQASDLISARKDGKSLAQIAADNGKTEEALINFIVTEEKAQLDTLLKDGKITQAQYDNMTANLETKVKEMVESTNVGKPNIAKGLNLGELQEKIASFLGVTVDDLKTARKDGKSLAQIAADNGKTEEALINFIVTEEKAQLDTLLKDGKITQAQYDNMTANLETKVKEMVESTNVGGPLFDKMKDAYRRGFKNGLKMGILDEKIADFLGIQASDLISARKDGKSLAQIAADNGKTEEALINFIVTEEKAQLDTLLKDGKITQAQYDNMTANLETKVKEMVESTNVGKPVPGFGGCRGGN